MMNAILGQPFCRLLWKEWRAVRGFAIVLLVLGLGLLWFTYTDPELGFDHRSDFIIPMIPMIALMGTVATTFAAEHEHKTAMFQRSLPVGQGTVVASKLVMGLAVSLMLALILLVTARTAHVTALSSLKPSPTILAACELFAWGTLISLLSRRALVALVVSSLIAVGVAYFVGWAYSPNEWDSQDPRHIYLVLTRWVIVGVVSLSSVAVGSAWFNDRSAELVSRWTRWRRTNAQALASRSNGVSNGVRGQLQRMVWCQVRGEPWLWFALAAAIAATFVAFFSSGAYSQEVVLVFILISTVLACISTARPETERNFLAAHPVSPSMVWCGGLVLPLAITAFVILVLWMNISKVGDANSVGYSHRLTLLRGAIGGPLLGFATGQLFARITRSTVTAFGIAMLTGVFAVAWLSFATAVEVPLLYSVLPFVISALLATSITTRPWLYGWSDRISHHIKYGSVFACIAVSIGVLIWFRATELPVVSQAKLAGLVLPQPAPSDKVQSFRQLGRTFDRLYGQGMPIRATDNGPLIERVVAGLENDRYAFPSLSYTSSDSNTLGEMVSLLSESVRQSVQQNDSVEAQHRIEALFEAAKLSKESGFAVRSRWGGTFAYAYSPILSWARMETTTPDQIADILDAATDLTLTPQDIERALAVQADANRRLVDGDLKLLPESFSRNQRNASAIGRSLPWERIRNHRFIDGDQFQGMNDLADFTSILSENSFPSLQPYWYDHEAHLLIDAYQLVLPDLTSMLHTLRSERVLAVRLALVRHQKLHDGKLPDTVLAIEDQLPADTLIDPMQGRPFVLVHPEAIADWVTANERPGREDWEPDPMKRYRAALLWSPDFYIERTPDSTRDHMEFWIDEGRKFTPLPISRLFADRDMLPLVTHVRGNQYTGSGATFPLGDEY